MSSQRPDMPCRHVVDITTDYLEGALAPEQRAQLEQHLLLCDPCVNFIEQTRATVRALGQLQASPASADAREAALHAFRALGKAAKDGQP